MSDKSGPTIATMINSIVEDAQALVRGHLELAKAEFKEAVSNFAKSSALLLVAVSIAHLALIFLLVAAGYGLVAAGLDPWLAFLIVSAILMLLTAYFVWAGIRRFKQLANSRRTFDAFSQTAESIKSLRD